VTTFLSRGFPGGPVWPLHPSMTAQTPGSTTPAIKPRSAPDPWSPLVSGRMRSGAPSSESSAAAAAGVRRHDLDREEPFPERRVGAARHRVRRHRRLPSAPRAPTRAAARALGHAPVGEGCQRHAGTKDPGHEPPDAGPTQLAGESGIRRMSNQSGPHPR